MAMKNYPPSVLAVAKGKTEARVLLSKGKFVKYTYEDVETGERSSKAKVVLVGDNGEEEAFFLIPLQKYRMLAIPDGDRNKGKRIWDGKKAVKI